MVRAGVEETHEPAACADVAAGHAYEQPEPLGVQLYRRVLLRLRAGRHRGARRPGDLALDTRVQREEGGEDEARQQPRAQHCAIWLLAQTRPVRLRGQWVGGGRELHATSQCDFWIYINFGDM